MLNKSIVILGNGFDVALGCQSRYSDFYKNSKELKKYADGGNELCKHILYKSKWEDWSDLESGLYQYSLDLTKRVGENYQEQSCKFKHEFEELRTALFIYINSKMREPLEANASIPVLNLKFEWERLFPSYITFNYSVVTYNYIGGGTRYLSNKDDTINDEKFVYQHGFIYDTHATRNRNPEDLVLGIDEKCQKVEAAHSFLYKSNQKIYDLALYDRKIEAANIYFIYGCSMGDSDACYFKKIFAPGQKGKIYVIYGFGKDALETIKHKMKCLGISLCDICTHNRIYFVDVRDEIKSKKMTHNIVDAIIKAD